MFTSSLRSHNFKSGNIFGKIRHCAIFVISSVLIDFLNARFLTLTSRNQIGIQYWMTSTRIIRITSGLVCFTIFYGVTSVICNALFEWNIFPTYAACLMDSDNMDNSLLLIFFVMPSVLMAFTIPIFDFVTFRFMKFLSDRSQQFPKGNQSFIKTS